MSDKPRMELSATQVIGGALAAASAAVAASLLGVYGTVIGAAVVSVVASVGGAVYTHSFRRGRQALEKARVQRTGRLPVVRDDGADATAPLDGQADAAHVTATTPEPDGTSERSADGTPQEGGTAERSADADGTSEPAADRAASRTGWRQRLAAVNPKAVGVTAACVLVLSLSGILFVESFLGQSISSAFGHGDDRGGNTLTQLTSNSRSDDRRPSMSPTATPTTTVTKTATPKVEPTERPTTSAPTEEPTSAPTTSKPTSPPPSSSKPTTSKPTTSKSAGTSSVESTDGAREQVPGE